MSSLDVTSRSLSKELDITGLLECVEQVKESLIELEASESGEEPLRPLALLLHDLHDVAVSLNALTEKNIKFPRENADRLYNVYNGCGMLIQESILRLESLKTNQESATALNRELHLRVDMIRIFRSVIELLSQAITTDQNTTQRETLAAIAALRNDITAMRMGIFHPDFNVGSIELRKALVTAEYAIPTPIHKHFIVPRRTSTLYTGREEEETIIKATFEDKTCLDQKILVLFGEEGSGKTELALKYAEDFRARFWGVFFIDGSSRKCLSEGYANIARNVGIEPNEVSTKKWLAEQTVPWLLIIDDANITGVDFNDMLPAGRQGCIIITSPISKFMRHGNAGKKYLMVQHMKEEDTIYLILRAAAYSPPWKLTSKISARKITKTSGTSPLGLVAAGNVIKHHLCSLEDYPAFHQRQSTLLLSHQRKSLWRWANDEHTTSALLHRDYIDIISPLEMLCSSLKANKQRSSRDAFELLNIFSYLDYKHFHLGLLFNAALNYSTEGLETDEAEKSYRNWLRRFRQYITTRLSQYLNSVALSTPSPLPQILRNDRGLGSDEFEEELRTRLDRATHILLQRSLIMAEEGENQYSMHRLVQKWVRERLSISDRAYWCGIATTIQARNVSALHYGEIGDVDEEELERELSRHIEHIEIARDQLHLNTKTVETESNAEMVSSTLLTGLPDRAKSLYDKVADIRDEIAGFIFADDEIISLIQAALDHPNIGSGKLESNLKRLLIEYSGDLLEHASTNVHIEVAKLIKNQSSYIAGLAKSPSHAEAIGLSLQSKEITGYADAPYSEIQESSGSGSSSRKYTHGKLTDSQPTSGQLGIQDAINNKETQLVNRTASSDKELGLSDTDDEVSSIDSLDEVKSFLQSGDAIKKLRTRLGMIVSRTIDESIIDGSKQVPLEKESGEYVLITLAWLSLFSMIHSLVSDLKEIPLSECIITILLAILFYHILGWTAPRRAKSGEVKTNRQEFTKERLYKPQGDDDHISARLATLPNFLDSVLDKAPFLNSEPPVPAGQTRIRWTCACGAKLFDDFVEIEPGSLQKLQDYLQRAVQNGGHKKESRMTDFQSIRISAKGALGWFSGIISMIWGGSKSSISRTSSTLPLHRSPSSNSPPEPAKPLDLLHVLLCIHTGETGSRLHQERLSEINTDRELLLFLRKEYATYRKVFSWLTLRSVTRVSLARFMVDSSEFAEVHRHAHVCMSDCVCIPPVDRIGTEYNCRPAPGVKPKYVPPIGPRYLSHHFSHPNCVRPTQRFIYNQLPKRTCGQLQASEDKIEFGWGVYFEEGWHWRTIYFLIVVLIASGSGIFGITWSITKGDIQGGFAISSLWMTSGSLFLGYIAVRSF